MVSLSDGVHDSKFRRILDLHLWQGKSHLKLEEMYKIFKSARGQNLDLTDDKKTTGLIDIKLSHPDTSRTKREVHGRSGGEIGSMLV